MKYIVYCTTNTVNQKIYIGVHQTHSDDFDGYIGCGVYVNSPCTYKDRNNLFTRAVAKYGPDKFVRRTIQEFDNEKDAYALEAELVTKEFVARNDNYNMVMGGKGGDWANQSKPCYQYTKEGKYVASYDSQQKAAIAVNRGFTTIKRAVHNRITAAGFYWTDEYVNELDLSTFKTTTNRKKVYVYSMDGKLEDEFCSVSELSRKINVSSSTISQACKRLKPIGNKYVSYDLPLNINQPKIVIDSYTDKIYQYSVDGEFIKEYNNAKEVMYKFNRHGLTQAIKDKHTWAGFQWRLEKVDKLPPVKTYSRRRVGRYDLDGNLLQIYDTVRECTKEYSGARHVLRGQYHTSGGYVFRYLD